MLTFECSMTGRTADRDWTRLQLVSADDVRILRDELGGEPDGDYVLVEIVPEGSDANTPHRWQVV